MKVAEWLAAEWMHKHTSPPLAVPACCCAGTLVPNPNDTQQQTEPLTSSPVNQRHHRLPDAVLLLHQLARPQVVVAEPALVQLGDNAQEGLGGGAREGEIVGVQPPLNVVGVAVGEVIDAAGDAGACVIKDERHAAVLKGDTVAQRPHAGVD